jgi:phosphate transport system substrate-binding protein
VKLYGAAVAAGLLAAALALGACSSSGGGDTTTPPAGNDTSNSASYAGNDIACSTGKLNGSGSTAQANAMDAWRKAYQQACSGSQINYDAVGSGDGIAAFGDGTAQWAGSDAALKPDDISGTAKNCATGSSLDLPMVVGPIAVEFNVKGFDSLTLNGPTIAKMFTGKITSWDDPAIAKLNPGAQLPGTKITVVHRSDESGTTKGFTTFLAAYSKQWESEVGVDKTVKWPTGTGAKGNDGVAACVKQTDGAVGYVEQAYALQNNFTTAAVKNKEGQFVEPSLDATSAAGEGAEVPDDLKFSTINAPGAKTYPITAVTFLLVWQDQCKAGIKPETAKLVKSWLDYALGDGQAVAPELQYAPLPDPIKQKAQAKVDGLVCNGSAIGSS